MWSGGRSCYILTGVSMESFSICEGGEKVDGKEFYEKTEEFAKKIINLAAEEELTRS